MDLRKYQSLRSEILTLGPNLKLTLKDDVLIISGVVDTYDKVLEVGQKAAQSRLFYGVVNKAEVKGYTPQPVRLPTLQDNALDNKKVDVLVIGGGVIGCAILRELTRYRLSCLLIDKEEDLAMQASSRNDGCVHVGIDLKRGTKKLAYLQRARKLYPQMCHELEIPYRQDGQTVAFSNSALYPFGYVYLHLKAKLNKVDGGVKILSRHSLLKKEPNLGPGIKWGAFLPGGGCVSPYELTIALGESAVINGAEVWLNTAALSMDVEGGEIKSVKTNRGTIYPRVVINAAGVFSDDIAAMAQDQFFSIHPRKGTDTIMDKAVYPSLSKTGITLYTSKAELKKTHSKGGGLIPTIDKNTLVGPDAVEVQEKEDFSTSKTSIDEVFNKHKKTITGLSQRDIITYFAGVRACTYEEDFVVQKGKWINNIVHAAGIQSPGLTAAPAIAQDVAKWAAELAKCESLNPNFNPVRKNPVKTRDLSLKERDWLIKQDPSYGHIVCRCEEISEGEIRDAINSVIPPVTVDGIKRRTRAGMGRCQGGFCQPLVLMLLAEEEKRDPLSIAKKGSGQILLKDTKEGE